MPRSYSVFPLLVCLTFGVACAASCSSPARQHKPTEATPAIGASKDKLESNPLLPPRAYSDGLGVVLELVPLKIEDGAAPMALLRITGQTNYLAGVTFLAKRIESSERERTFFWGIPLDGETAYIVQNTAKLDREGAIEVRPIRSLRSTTLQYDASASAAINIDELFEDYYGHLADGSLAKLAEYDRAYALKEYKNDLAAAQEKMNVACGASIDLVMDWDQYRTSEDFRKTADCEFAMDMAGAICAYAHSSKEELRSKLLRVECAAKISDKVAYDPKKRLLSVRGDDAFFRGVDLGTALLSRILNLHHILFRSASGLVVFMPAIHDPQQHLYAGFGPKLYRQVWKRGTGKHFHFWSGATHVDARAGEGGKWKVSCPRGAVDFQELDGSERDRVLAESSFEAAVWTREPFVLARDHAGTYYYVDRNKDEVGGLGYRVFTGPRGKVKLSTMVDIIDDAQGKIFSTTSGSLRLVLTKGETALAHWKKGKRSEKLVLLSPMRARPFIYDSLGVYDSERLGTICSMAEAGKN